MPKLAATITATTTQEVEITPKLRTQILNKLHAYAGLRSQIDDLKAKIVELGGEIGDLRDDTGAMSISLEGFKVTLVAPTYRKLNKKKFVALGGDLKILDQATEEKPKKSYNKITVPGEKEEDSDE